MTRIFQRNDALFWHVISEGFNIMIRLPNIRVTQTVWGRILVPLFSINDELPIDYITNFLVLVLDDFFRNLMNYHFGWRHIRWRHMRWRHIIWRRIGWRHIGWRHVGWRHIGWRQIGYLQMKSWVKHDFHPDTEATNILTVNVSLMEYKGSVPMDQCNMYQMYIIKYLLPYVN